MVMGFYLTAVKLACIKMWVIIRNSKNCSINLYDFVTYRQVY